MARDPQALTLLAGGYSIVRNEFVALRIEWDSMQARWIAALEDVPPTRVKVIGDREYRSHAKWRARRIRDHRSPTAQDWHTEPLAAIDAYSRDSSVYSVGGGVQLAKAFIHGAARGYAIREPLSTEATLRGTRLSSAVATEYETQNQLVDMARWSLKGAYFGGVTCRAYPSR